MVPHCTLRPDFFLDFGAIKVSYLLAYLLTYLFIYLLTYLLTRLLITKRIRKLTEKQKKMLLFISTWRDSLTFPPESYVRCRRGGNVLATAEGDRRHRGRRRRIHVRAVETGRAGQVVQGRRRADGR